MISRRFEPRLRLLLSWRKKVLQAGEEPAKHGFDRRRFDSFDDYRSAELENINRQLAHWRERGRRFIERRALALRTALQAKEDLPARVKTGRLSPEAANEENRRFEKQIAHLREEIARYNKLLTCESPEEAGGFIDRPLSAYPRRSGAVVGKVAQAVVPRSQNHFLLLCAMAGLLVMGLIVQQTLWGGEIHFEAEAIGGNEGGIRLRCHNGTLYPIQFFAPWADGLEGEKTSRTYGVDVYVATEEEAGFRRLSSEGDLWHRQGQPNLQYEPSRIEPGLIEEFFFDLHELGKRLPGVRAVQLLCTREDGINVFKFSIETNDGLTG